MGTALLAFLIIFLSGPLQAAPATNPAGPSGVPALSISEGIDRAQRAMKERRIDLAGRYIRAATLEYDDGSRVYPDGKKRRGLFWYIHWAWSVPRLGGDRSARVFMNGEVVDEPHGP